MDGYEIAATVLISAAKEPAVNLEDHVDVFSPLGEHVAELLSSMGHSIGSTRFTRAS